MEELEFYLLELLEQRQNMIGKKIWQDFFA